MIYWVYINVERTDSRDTWETEVGKTTTGTMGFTIEASSEDSAIRKAMDMVEENGYWSALSGTATERLDFTE